MQVNFTFDKAAVERRGHALEDVHRTVKSLFAVYNLPGVSDGETLSFKDKGHGDDFACMWDIILSLLRSDTPPVELLLPTVPMGRQKGPKVHYTQAR